MGMLLSSAVCPSTRWGGKKTQNLVPVPVAQGKCSGAPALGSVSELGWTSAASVLHAGGGEGARSVSLANVPQLSRFHIGFPMSAVPAKACQNGGNHFASTPPRGDKWGCVCWHWIQMGLWVAPGVSAPSKNEGF